MGNVIQASPVVPGAAVGEVLASQEPLSLWGGYDQETGEIIDRRHPLSGESAAGKVLAVPFSRGSSTTTAVLLESLRAGTAPAAIVTTGEATFFALAGIVAEELWGHSMPVVAVDTRSFELLKTGERVEILESGGIARSDRG